jgi:hypothetical protein
MCSNYNYDDGYGNKNINSDDYSDNYNYVDNYDYSDNDKNVNDDDNRKRNSLSESTGCFTTTTDNNNIFVTIYNTDYYYTS